MVPGVNTITGSDGLVGYWEGQNEEFYTNIKSLTVGMSSYEKTLSPTYLYANQETFYCNPATSHYYGYSTIFIHFADEEPPLDKIIKVGNAHGFSIAKDQENGAYYNDVYYEPRVKSIPNLSRKKDPFNFGIQSYTSVSLSFINEDGYFDTADQDNLFSQTVRVLTGNDGDDYDDFSIIMQGYIENFNINKNLFTIKLMDNRKSLTQSIPQKTFNLIDYPNISASDVGTLIPMAWDGVHLKAPCKCIDSDPDYFDALSDTDTVNFLIMDVSLYDNYKVDDIDYVYIKENDAYKSVSFDSDKNAGKIMLTKSVCISSADIYCDFTGYATASNNPVGQLIEIIKMIGGVNYNSTNWNTTETLASYLFYQNLIASNYGNTAIYESEKIDIKQIIEKLCKSVGMMLYVTYDGKYSLKYYWGNRTSSKTFEDDEWLTDPERTYDSTDFLSSMIVNYNKNLDKNEYTTYENTLYKSSVLSRYKREQSKTIETYISEEDTAFYISSTPYIGRQQYILEKVKRKCPLTSLYKSDGEFLELMDFVECSHHRYGETAVLKTYEIISININLTDSIVEFEFLEVI